MPATSRVEPAPPQRTIRTEVSPSGALAGRFEAMASPCEVFADGAPVAELRTITQAVADEVWRIEQHWSRYRTGTVVDRINTANGQPVTVDAETADFLDYAARLHAWSRGLFDVTSGVLRRVWTFDGSDRVPDAAKVGALLPLVGWHRVTWKRPVLQMPAGMEIDFGGIGKEYAVDRALRIAARETTRSVLVNCGGDLACSGPRAGGLPWLVGVDTGQGPAAAPPIRISRGAIATSGDTRRFLLKDGVRYGHVLDPATGWPVPGAPRVVTVAAATCTEAGVLATLALLHGRRAGEFLQSAEAHHSLTP